MDPTTHILHLEEDPTDAELVRSKLEPTGLVCRITHVRTFAQFHAALRKGELDVILSDYRVPMSDGMSALRLARELRPEIPFIFVSDAVGEEATIEALKNGATDYVIKQNMGRLASSLKRALQDARDRREHNLWVKHLVDKEAMWHDLFENIGIGVALISPRMEILELNKRMRQWFPDIDPGRRSLCYRTFNTPPRQEICSYCPTCKTLRDGLVHEAETRTPQDSVMRNYRIVSSPLFDVHGKVIAAIEMVDDVTERSQARGALQRSHEMLRAIIEAAPVAIIGLDPEGRVHSVWNPAAEKMLGWRAQEVMGRPMPMAPVDRQEDFGRFRKQIRNGMILDGEEVRRQRRDGTPVDYSIHTSPLHDAKGRVSGNIAVLLDITERRRNEMINGARIHLMQFAATHSLDELLEEAVNEAEKMTDSRIGFYHFVDKDQQSLTLQNWSTRTKANFCKTRGKGLHYPIVDAGVWVDCVRERKPVVHNDYMSLTHRKGLPEGHAEVVRELVVPVMRGKKIKAILGVGNKPADYSQKDVTSMSLLADFLWEITKRKQAEESIRKLSQAIQQSPVSIVITDVAGKIEFVNARFTEVTGYTFAEALGRNPRILKSGETPADEYSRLWETISSGGVWQGEFHNRKKNGELFWEHASIAPLRDTDGAVTHYVAVKEDITERRVLENQLRQSQKMDAVGQLAGGVAHDFNNMLGVIIGYTEMILNKETLNDSLQKYLEKILEAADRSSEITGQLLAFARKQAIVPKILDLDSTVEKMLKLLRRVIGEDIDLAWLPRANSWRVKMDASQIDQILVNLCVNARDAIAGVGKVTIETQKAVFDDAYCAEHQGFFPGEYLMLAVSDNGRGMDKQTIDRIFEPFFTTKGLGEGTGLGLSTVYGIVKQNAGFINVYSEPGHGSTFKIYLRRHAGKTELDGEENPVAIARGRETILLVEDEIGLLDMVKEMLETLGYAVLASSTPKEAIRIANENAGHIELLLIDVVMPEMNGRDLAKKLCSLHPELKCLFMSGYTGSVIAQQGLLEERINFIQKPFSIRALATKVREVLDNQSSKGLGKK